MFKKNNIVTTSDYRHDFRCEKEIESGMVFGTVMDQVEKSNRHRKLSKGQQIVLRT